jgi:hypothetical protein
MAEEIGGDSTTRAFGGDDVHGATMPCSVADVLQKPFCGKSRFQTCCEGLGINGSGYAFELRPDCAAVEEKRGLAGFTPTAFLAGDHVDKEGVPTISSGVGFGTNAYCRCAADNLRQIDATEISPALVECAFPCATMSHA